MRRKLILVAVALAVALGSILVSVVDPSPAEAGCWPHIHFSSKVATNYQVPGGGQAIAKVQVRGMHYPVCLTCMHGEANSNTNVKIDYIYWYGYVWVERWGVFQEAYSGAGICVDCTGGYYKSPARWFYEAFTLYRMNVNGHHFFKEGGWYWDVYTGPTTASQFCFPTGFP